MTNHKEEENREHIIALEKRIRELESALQGKAKDNLEHNSLQHEHEEQTQSLTPPPVNEKQIKKTDNEEVPMGEALESLGFFLVAIFGGIIGGLIGFAVTVKRYPDEAKLMLYTGIISTPVIALVILWLVGLL